MASRRQRQFDRKYSSYRKYTASEDVNYGSHSSRSAFRSESTTSRSDTRGRSVSSEIIAGSDTRSYPVYIAIQDYQPDATDVESIPLEQGQIVEVLDKKNPASWLVRTKARPPLSGWVPGSYFETPTEYYKQRRRTRELDTSNAAMTEDQEALLKRDQVYHDLLRSEEEFVAELRACVDHYVHLLDDVNVIPAVVREKEKLTLNLSELYNFHANVMLKGLNYYSDDPGKVGQTFTRLEHDFDHHVQFLKDLPATLELLEKQPFKDFFQSIADKYEAGAHTYADHLKNVAERVTHYQNFFKEFVKYSSRANQSSKSMQKALELTLGIPQRVRDLVYTNNILQYPGDTNKLGSLIRHDSFEVSEGDEGTKECYVFLFKNKLMITQKNDTSTPTTYTHLATIRLNKYTVSTHPVHENTIILKPCEPGLPSFSLTSKDPSSSEYVKKAWLKDITEEKEAYAAERENETETTSEYDVHLSDMRSEFSEYSGSRIFIGGGPEEGGPPRKKVKSPPAISPTGSSTSIYSGGSSSVDWTTTGTTLEMQGTRVTRTQYGFRTLQESSAKMCLKVTGYPLPDITWYKDDVQLHEDQRHTFYSDEDGFFALTIDPVQVEDTGRYTCMATNEYGQASTSAFFRVLKVEKEAAPPKFINMLKDRECKEGEVISFECEVEGWPEPELVWLVDDQPLRPSQDFKIEYDGLNAKLEIRDAQPDDTGVYCVKIQNEFGTAECKAELVVIPDPDKNHVAPDFQAVLEDVECNEGDEVRFKSVITGDPNPEITWMINGIPLSESEKVRFISEDGICILTIKDVTRHFDGTVTCQGSNRLGTASCNGRLKVRVPPTPPTFAKPLEDRVTQENAVVSFEVDVLGYPDPEVAFTLKGKELKHGVDGVEIAGADGYYKVIISGCKVDEHDGEIVCRAVNEHGSAESRARLTVEPMEESRSAPTFIKDIEDQTVKYGAPAVFETTVRGSPNPEVTWFINGQKMDNNTPGVKIEVINHDHKLTIDSAQYAGTILCRAENVAGRFETKARLTVIPQEKPKKAPRFTELLSDRSDVQGSTVVFEARVEAEPKPDVRWFLKDVELKSSENIVIREFDGSVKLELRGIKLDDAGEVRCQASNSEGSAISAAQLMVTRTPFPPSFDKQPLSVTVERGFEARFEAHAESVPAPTYQWSIDGRKIRDTTEGCRLEMVDGMSVLIVDTNIHSISSTISVVAENNLGSDETGARLIVEEKKVTEQKIEVSRTETQIVTSQEGSIEMSQIEVAPTKLLVTEEVVKEEHYEETKVAKESIQEVTNATEQVSEQLRATLTSIEVKKTTGMEESIAKDDVQEMRTEPTKPPKITRDLKDQTVIKGEPCCFAVVVENATEAKWYHNGRELTTLLEGVKITQETKYEFNLSIDSSMFSTGTITVRARNDAGSVETKCEMKIVEKPDLVDKLPDVSATLGEPFKVEVSAKGSPQFKWMINGQTLEDGKDGVHIVSDRSRSTLSVDKAESSHSGTLSLITTNEHSSVESSSQITLIQKSSAPQIVEGPQNITIKEKATAEFKVKIIGHPEPTVKWAINDKLVEESSTMVISRNADDYSLRISDVSTSSAGTVKVTAENTMGSDSRTADLKVEPSLVPLEFKKQLTDVSVKEDDSLKLEVVLEKAQPNTITRWYINGKELQESPEIQMTDVGDGTYRLTVQHVKIDQAGTVTAKAMNPVGECECTAKITVDKGTKKPEFTKTPQNHEAYIDDDSVKFSAIVVGTPTPTVAWYLNNSRIENSEEIKVKFEEDTGKTSIRIYKPQISQSGTVRVVAENSAGSAEATATLKVDRRMEVPKFVSNMDDRQVNEGDTVKYTSTVEGYPEPTVTWLLNGEPVSKHANITVSDEAGRHTIEIKEIIPEQAGELSCQASNTSGMKKQNVTLSVKRTGEAPLFSKNLDDLLVTEGEVTIMEAKLSQVKPKPNVTWLRDGKPFTSDDHFQLSESDDGTLQLKIISTKMEDKSRITIRAENYFGSAECSASLGVVKQRPMAKPAFQSNIAPIRLTEGDSLHTKLLITGDPTPFVKWYINNQLVCETEDTEIKNVDGVYSLTIHGTTADMTGKIRCVAYNKMGEVSTEGPLEVVAPIPVEFETSLCDATCREGDTLKLKAVLLGEPTPVVSWYVNDKKLEESQNIKIHSEKGTYTVTIKDITCDYSGKVVCEAVNEYGRASSEAMLLVLPRGEPPDFLEWLSNVRARQGSKVVHKVVFTGDPKPTITWYINNKEVQNSSEISIVTDDKNSILTIHNFNPEKHVGEIICKADNDAGEVSCTANMVTYTSDMFSESESEAQAEEVIGDDMTLTEDESIREEIQRTPTPVMAPKFITKIKDSRAKRGHEAIFECVVPDTKGVCCKWLKDGKEIELIARIRVQSRTVEGYTTQELIIDDVRPEDAGIYTVIVENNAGRVQCEATLTVVEAIEKTLERAPEFIVKLQDKTTKIHDKVNFECKVVGEPQPKVLWYHENKVLEEHAKEVYIESEDGIQRLVISSTEMKHQGKYACVAENSAGSSRTEATLNVEAATEAKVGGGPAEFVELLRSCTVTEGQQAVLKCKVKGEPRPKIKWTKDGKEVEMTARIRSEYKDDGSLTLTIDGVTQQDAGEYRCHAENEHGSAWTEGPIAVVAFGAPPQEGEAPDFVQPIRPVLVAEGETAVLEGKVSGKPKPSIKWYKNGEDVKPSEHFVVESLDDGTQRLTVKNVTMDDMDEYRCSASNDYGDVWSDVTLSVKKKQQEAPSFTKTLVEVSIVEGESATYECKVTGEPQPEIKWFKDKEEISTVDEHFAQTKEGDGTARLVIKSAKVNDSGEIRCEASNTAGTARTAAPLTVTLPEEEIAPKFTRDLTACQITEGEVARFECKVKGTPLPLVRWFKDGEEVKPGDGVTIEALPDGTNKLTINDAKLTDQGNYRVEATNVAGSMSSKAPLSVQAPETLKLRRPLHDITVEKGTKIQLTVEVEGQPKTVKWYKESKQVTATSTTKIERVSDAEYKLEVENCETSDSGAYRVVLSTESESIESKCVVTVKEKDIKVQLPSFKSGLKDQAVPKGQPLVLEVEIEGKPRTVKWYKNGDILKDAKPEDLGDGKYRLTVPDFKESNVGEYSVVAENEVGEVESKAKITMKEVPDDERDKTKPEIVTGLVPTSVKEGETATFSVKVKGPVKTVKWYKNGKEIPDANTKDNGDGVFQLIIPNANKNDTADYRVVISNDAGDAHSAAALTVKLPQIEIVKGLEDIKIDRKQTGVLAIETNRPPKQVKWYKNGKEITPSDKAVPNKIDDKKYQLSIPDADKDDTANYKVVLTDDDGNTAESACALTVKVPAAIELVKALEDTVVPKKQTGVLEIQTNKPAKMVKWYKNGREIAPSDKAVPKTVADNKYQLSIPDADKDDCADYKVVLTDDDGNTAESSCVLTVKLPGAIEFVRGLEDTVVLKKQSGVLEVETNKPAKVAKWYKNGKEITPSDKDVPKVVADNKYQLTIPDADKDDTATYKIVLTDDDGNTAESSCALTVKLPEAIEIVKALEDIVMPKKQTAALEIQTNKPAKVVKWYKNGKEIAPSDKAVPKAIADNKYQLSIPDVGKDDTANYKVVLMDDDGNNAESACALTVKLPAGIEIVKGLEDTTVPKGKKATLEVQTNRAPKQVKWYKNGKELTPSDKPEQKTVDDNKYQLVIPNADDVDAADYKVVLVDDDDNSADSSCALTVRLRDKEPKIIKGLDDRTVAAGLPTIWELETEGSPRTVKWYKNGKEIAGAAAAQVKMTKVDDNRYVLEIPKCALGDTGSYKVEVENDAGKASSTGKLTVEQKLTFLIPLKDQTITEGETVEFKVETNAKPNTVKWYKNGETITPDARFIVTGEETKYRLVIKNATRNDTAEYKVVLSNSAGDTDSSAKLTVLKAKPGLPKIVKQLDDQIAAKGTSMVFEVKVEGEVDEVRWFKDTIPITAGTNAIIEKVDDTTYRLTIPIADIGDVGHYSIDAVNESGKASSDAKGEVDEKPEIVKGLVNTEVCQGDDSLFKVEVSTPVRTVKWYKNGQEVKPSKHFEPKKIGPKKYELAINRAELDDCANFKVVLANAAGECDSSAELTVTKPNILKLLESLKDIDVNEGEPINLKVRVEGIPKTVKWYKNGAELSPNDVQMDENVETGEYSLVIPQSKKSDGAGYRISLVNEKGEIYSGAVAHVKTVKAKDATSPVNFLSPLEDTEVAEGDMLTLKCVVAGIPFPELTWTKDGVELEKDDRIAIRVALDGTATLRIRDCRRSDFGQYRITAKNECSTETSTCQVTVKEKREEPSKPRFIIPLKSCEAEIGEKKEFEVKVRGFPKPTLEWLLNGSPIDLDGRCSVTDRGDGVYYLTIRDVRDSDFGTFRCIARNEVGKDECQAEFGKSSFRREKEDDRYPPRFNVPLWDRRIPVNDPLSIECHVDAKPVAQIEWFKDGKKLEIIEGIEIRNTSDGACRVRIARFGKEDVGVYMCVATNPLGVADTRSTYSVEVTEKEEVIEKNEYAPRFNPGLEDLNINAGQSIRLSCTVDAIPKAGIVWYKDGLPLRSGGRFTITTQDDGTCILEVKNTVAGDEGAYRCVASNEHGTTNTSCLVTVKVPKTEVKKEGEEPFFTKGLVDMWTDRGETFTLKCAVKGDPFPEIKWFRNGTLVRDSSRTRIETAVDGSCLLTVKDCTMSDEGVYRCEAENKHGKAKTQATAHVQMSIAKTEVPKLEMGSPPRFIIPLEDQTVVIGGVIDLDCKVTGEPMPQVKWSKDGGPIWEDSRYEWEVDEAKGTYHLRITSVNLNDEGTYRCVATNESGSVSTKSFVRIDDGLLTQAPAKSMPPRFTIHLGDARAVEGQPLQLECKVEGSPLPELTWHKDGAEIHPSDRVQMSMGPDGVAKLVIPQCCMDDEGIYRVIATNPSGSAHDKGTATVKKAPRDSERRSAHKDHFDANKLPKLIEPLENVKVPEKEGFKLRCKFSGEPKLAIKWFKDGERVFPYGRLELVETDDGVCELLVESSIRQDAGGYRCVAENQYGSVRTTCEVTVIQKERKPVTDFDATLKEGKAPGFTVPLTVRRAKPGENVTFECVPYGNPFPEIKWLKDGIELSPSANVSFESLPDGTQRLHLVDVNFFNEGFFRCVATNEYGTASTKAELSIDGDRKAVGAIISEPKEPEECKPRIRRGLYNMSTHKGNVVEMIVCATGWPTPTVKWFKDGKEIVSDGPTGHRVIFTDERGIHHLVILNAGPDDEGDYSLEATNRLGVARTEGALSIIRPRQFDGYEPDDRGGMPFPPGFVRQLKNKHVFNRMPTIFDCLVVGYPAPEVDWFHNGTKITPGGRVKIQACGGGSHALIILDTTLDDIGEYMAVARNCHGTATSSAILDVTVPYLDNIKFNGGMDVTPYLTEEYGFKKPHFANLPTPPDRGPFIKEVTGHYLTLSWIPTKRAPPRYPQVSYVVEIRELPEKDWTVLDYNIPEPVCKVRNLELGKSYQFRVRAENIYGISDPSPASPPSRLMAPPQPVLDKRTKKVIPLLDPYAEKALNQAHAEQYACAPWFVPGVVEKRYCAENDTLTITLNVAGYPDPEIKWKFRGWDIDTSSPTSSSKVYTIGGTETILLINSFNKDNVGQYQCFATNPYGEAQQNIMVDLATRPTFIQPLSNRTFSDKQPMRLDVRIEGEPFPELKWLKEWRPIVESSRVKFVQDGPYLCSLIINEPMWRDSGVYTCIAVNAAGQATTSCSITVEADGDFNDVELPKKRTMVEARKIHEIYEIAEDDETRAASGAPFRVKERRTGDEFLAQLKPIDDALQRNVDMYNSLDHPNVVRFHEVIKDGNHALVVYENATGALLDSLAHPGVAIGEPEGGDRERLVRVFIRQLLLALKHMHDMRIAHLDLRPETIMLQDDKLKLVDFGQSRRLLRGLITGSIQGTPEFVSPEIVRGYPLTLATDMWSVGTLTYVLLTGISPFHGDDDNETLANINNCAYSMKGDEWKPFTDEAIDFVKNLLKEIPAERMTVDEALGHPWIADPNLKTIPLTADSLREFKYRHKWLERRVFVQQTPSEQLLETILTPSIITAEPEKRPEAESARAVELYDYLRIKERSPPAVEEVTGRRKERMEQNLLYPSAYQHFDARHPRNQQPFDYHDLQSQQLNLPDSFLHSTADPRDRRSNDPRRQGGRPIAADHNGLPVPMKKIPLDQFGRLFRPEDLARIPHDSFGRPLDLNQRLPPDQFGRMAQLPLDELKKLKKLGPAMADQFGQPIQRPQIPQNQKQTPADQHNIQEKKKLVPQSKGETPSKKVVKTTDVDELDDPKLLHIPLRMIRGERREIEEEIANRILSDISEEGSITGSLGSAEDLEAMFTTRKQAAREMPPRGSRSRSTTPRAESDASTPTVSPVSTVKEGDFFNDFTSLPEKDMKVLERLESDPSIPVGAPLFLEDLHDSLAIIDSKTRTPSPAGLSPQRSKPGTKSPVLLSPGREHSMEVVIATKRGKLGFLPPGELPPEIDDEDAKMDERKQEVKSLTHKDEFQDLREKLKRENERRKADREELERYRPKNIYKDDLEFDRPGYDVDDSPWDSHYQIGPDTYLMATQGPSFNARVRDYRRNLWGDGAPFVREGILGYRNQDITVRERRRYTDILRELQTGIQPKSNENATALRKAPSLSAIERIKADIERVSPSATRRNADGTYAPIFVSRLRDVYLRKSSFVVFECVVSGSPSPNIEWQFQGSTLQNDGKYMIEQGQSVCRLTISQPAVYDIGEYTCIASNEYGSDKTSSLLITGEAPARPGRPECEITSDTEALVTWEAPDGPTYLEGIVYRFEYREAGPDDYNAPWVMISDSVDDEAAVVKHLEPLTFYQFRVTARNGFGCGVPSLTSRIVQTNARGAPKLPLDGMRGEFRFNVLTAPQKTSARQLEEISEESESDNMSQIEPYSSLELLSEDPTNRFQIESLLFKGRFSVIRHSVNSQKEAGAHCVVKIRCLQDGKEMMREYETLKEAQHDNVQHLIAAYLNNGFLYLFCERLYEDVFSRFTHCDYYTEEQIRLTIGQLTGALHWLHFRGIVHLDVNPYNVMFQSKRNWIVKLVDFGSAQFTKESIKPSEFDVAWAAPELHVKDTPVTVQSDVWGMGVITFCLLSGFHPFTSEYDRPEEIKENVINVKCDPNLIPVNASQEALSFVTWALKKNPLRRMRTDEALSHRFLSSNQQMVRRRETIKYASSRLCKTALLTKQNQTQPESTELERKYGGKTVQ